MLFATYILTVVGPSAAVSWDGLGLPGLEGGWSGKRGPDHVTGITLSRDSIT